MVTTLKSSDKLTAMGVSANHLNHIAVQVQSAIYTELRKSGVLDSVARDAASDGANHAARVVRLTLEQA